MTGEFNGFPPALFSFLEELAQNNNREWFAENKADYEAVVVAPMMAFIEAAGPRLLGISPWFDAIAKKTGGSMFRIYRDIRFSKDKRPYKEHVACQFRHRAGTGAHAPGFYVHLACDGVRYGGGVWQPPSAKLHLIRERIRDRPDEWQAILDDPELKRRFGGITGDSLIRPPRGFQADDPHIADIRRKSFFVMESADPARALEKGFIDDAAAAFRAADPLMGFLCLALGLPH